MADQQEEELRMAMRISMQNESPEPKRSKQWENAGCPEESPEIKSRKVQRELMAAAAERRMMVTRGAASGQVSEGDRDRGKKSIGDSKVEKNPNLGEELSGDVANQLFLMVFGSEVTRDILAQWSNQGIRFSSDPETSMGLVQHEGGPCGVLAAIQAIVLKYIMFLPDKLGKPATNMPHNSVPGSSCISECVAPDDHFVSLAEYRKSRALVRSMGEILFLCGGNRRAVISTLSILDLNTDGIDDTLKDGVIAKALGDLSIESGSDLQKVLRVGTYTSQASAFQRLEAMIPVFRSRMGAMLFLISALLSRGLDFVQSDRDDPSQSLVTAPFGHASQEIVNLLLCGEAVAHVFDGRMDLGGGMFLKGISINVEVGFLTLLESLNFCKVGQYLKCPKWPIWVIGSESHYTVLFALSTSVQDENEFEIRERQIRRSFDAQDHSGGGGFISVEGFHHVLRETNINLLPEKLDRISSSGFIVWSEFWQVLLDLDKCFGGLKDTTGLMGNKIFDLYHFNGIAKSDLNGCQRPRLTKLKVSVPPKWTPEEFMAGVNSKDVLEVANTDLPQHAPLVDCIRTRWARATCNWVGDPPSIV